MSAASSPVFWANSAAGAAEEDKLTGAKIAPVSLSSKQFFLLPCHGRPFNYSVSSGNRTFGWYIYSSFPSSGCCTSTASAPGPSVKSSCTTAWAVFTEQLTHLPRSRAAASHRVRRSVRSSRFRPPPRQWNTKCACFFRRACLARLSTSSGLVKDRAR